MRRAAATRIFAVLAAAAASSVAVAGCGDAGAPLGGGPTRAVSAAGQLHALAGPLPAGLQVTLRAGGSSQSASVAANGSFQIQADLPGDSVDLIIDTQGARTILPALLRLPAGTAFGFTSIVLVPASWTVAGGRYDGETVDISLDAAFRPPCANGSDINCDGYYPKAWFTGPKLWAPQARPAPLAFDHERTHQAIGAADSVTFWSFAARMNADAGMELFRPARSEEIVVNTRNEPVNGILVRVDTTLAGFGAWTNWWWNASGNLFAGLVKPRTLAHLRSGPLMTHELLHTHGLKHSCSWTTVMSGYGNPCGASGILSLHDVAYLQLAYALDQRQRALGAQHALIPALQGERVVLRGLPPYAPASLSSLRLMTGDSIGHASSDEAGGRPR
jgi:hypothetical protein